MAGMEIDSLSEETSASSSFSPRDRIVQKIVKLGIPLDQIDPTPSGLVNILKDNELSVPNLVYTILPTDEEVTEVRKLSKKESGGGSTSASLKELYSESLLWIQWMMFKCDPHDFLKDMVQKSAGLRAACGAVWGQNDLAYRCRTCEHDPTCAICVPCFENGNHKDHDYSIIYTGGGCCDCGDVTAWKSEGFCSKHKGTQQIQPLSEELMSSVGPVIDNLIACWRNKVVSAEHWKRARDSGRNDMRKYANKLSSNVVDMLLDFCNSSESLLSFISKRIIECSGMLEVLVRAERFLDKEAVKRLHVLLLTLLGEPLFKFEFAKVLIPYYVVNLNETMKESSDLVFEKSMLLQTFCVQVFTVPTLTMRLVREVDLLGTLLGCLTNIFLSCAGEDGRVQVNKWASMDDTTLRLIEDIRYVMSHNEVPIYIAQERPDISRAWLRLLSLVQGMDPQKRATGIHTEEENDNVSTPFALCVYLGNVYPLLVGGAFPITGSKETNGGSEKTSAKAGKFIEEGFARGNCLAVPASATWLIFECLKTIENWLIPNSEPKSNLLSLDASSSNGRNYLNLRKKLFRTRTNINRGSRSFLSRVGLGEQALEHDNDPMDITEAHDMFPEHSSKFAMLDDNHEDINSGKESGSFKIMNFVDWPDIVYDVSSQEISLHVPLHRLLSLLLWKVLTICYEDKLNGKSAPASSQQNIFFQQVLKGAHPYGFSAYIMETPLRLRVFCAQVRAGMWRRNGDSATLSCEWYRSGRWLEIGIEPDLFLLQCCAALAPPDLFVKRIQQRFGLTNYTDLNLADQNEYESVLVQEMLTLLIQIVKERRYCGLSTTEILRRELVHKLAIGDATHSQLLKALPRDLSKCDQLRNILDTLAVYSKPSGMKQGKYTLRKAFWKELDLYHPRWSSRDLQIAEERYSRFCQVSALNAQLPKWAPVFEPLNTISRIATSKPVLQIIRAVIFYAVFSERSSSSRAPDGVLITALHLLSLALDICETQPSMDTSCNSELHSVLIYAGEEFDTGVMDEIVWKNQSLLSLLVALMRKHKEGNDHSHIEMKQCSISSILENLLEKFAELSPTCSEIIKRLAPDMTSDMPHRSLITNASASTSDAKAWLTKARERQAAVMERMKAEQSKFIASLSSELDMEPESTKSDKKMPISEFGVPLEESAPICSLCRDSDSDSPLCFLILLQKSRLTSFVDRGPISWDDADQSDKERRQILKTVATEQSVMGSENNYGNLFSLWFPEVSDDGTSNSASSLEMLENDAYQSVTRGLCAVQPNSNILLSPKTIVDPQKHRSLDVSNVTVPVVRAFKFGPRNCDGIHISSCGHAVHQKCHDRYLTSLRQRHLRRLGFEGGHIVDPDLGELLCPLCRRFANSIIPAYSSTLSDSIRQQILPSINSQKDNLHVPFAFSLLQNAAEMVGHKRFQKVLFTEQNTTVKPALEPSLRKLYMLYSSNSYDTLSETGKLIQSLVLWDTLIYSIISTEVAARGKRNTYLSSSLSVDNLYGEFHLSSEFVLTLLLRVAHTTRVSCHRDVLLRFKGLQLLAGSICFGMSGDKSSNSDGKRGTSLSFLEHVDEEFSEAMFFKQAADPILSHDPFTSLMWTLFCLPFPFLSSKEILLPLVHLFYCVSVVQALITCYSSENFDTSCFDDCVLNGICKVMGESEHARKFFVSNFVNDPCHPEDMVRRITFPYLRRCALLWKMLQSSTSSSLHDSLHTWQMNPYAKGSDFDNPISVELNGIKEFEDMFQIQSLDLVLKNEVMHTLAVRWCNHFCEEFHIHSYGTTLSSTPAVPFKLIQLPRLYQDLIQRYIKVPCSSCKIIPEEPALCLLCGKLCSSNWKSCCRASRCLNHATVCGAGIGVFLLVRRTTVFLQRTLRESFWPSPYLDAFGEEDHDVQRGRPLYLNEERYAALTYLIATHGLDRTSEVLRQTTININGTE